MIGDVNYTNVNVLRAQEQNNYRNPEKPFKDILEGNFEESQQTKLKNWCKRMSPIHGDIWVAVSNAKCIQVIDREGHIRDITCTFQPYLVIEAPWGDIIAGTTTG